MQRYDKDYIKKARQELVEQEVAEEVIEETIEVEPIEGTVTNCDQLFVREEPTIESDALGIIKKGSVIRIYDNEPVNDFYHICTESGLEGYCMKEFIAV